MTFQVYSKAELIEKLEQAQKEIIQLRKEVDFLKKQEKLVANMHRIDAELVTELLKQRDDLLFSLKYYHPEAFSK